MKMTRFVYVIYIRTTPKKLWRALTDPELVRRYFYGAIHESEWNAGAPWGLKVPDGRVADSGDVLEVKPGRRFVLKSRNELKAELRDQGYSRMICDLEPAGSSVKLTIVHELRRNGSKFIEAVSEGWPPILSSQKYA